MNLATPALSIYLMADADTAELAEAAVRGGADLRSRSASRSPTRWPTARPSSGRRSGRWRRGMTTPRALDADRATCAPGSTVPLVPMTYASPVMAYGERAVLRATPRRRAPTG